LRARGWIVLRTSTVVQMRWNGSVPQIREGRLRRTVGIARGFDSHRLRWHPRKPRYQAFFVCARRSCPMSAGNGFANASVHRGSKPPIRVLRTKDRHAWTRN
jgi:hypothetical protein